MRSGFFLLTIVFVIFSNCREVKETNDTAEWMHLGDSLVTKTFDTLRNTLLRTIGEKGFPGAISFCNTEALNLTNTYAGSGVTIKRTSDKIRNPANKADDMEREVLSEYLKLKKDKKELKPVLKRDATGNRHYFKPILMQAMCLNCHGEKLTRIKPETFEAIVQKYPADSAFGYKEGDLRGAWHMVFSKN